MLDGGAWLMPCALHQVLYSWVGNPLPLVHEAGWSPGLVWTGMENLAPVSV
jgi:hypothetical protein